MECPGLIPLAVKPYVIEGNHRLPDSALRTGEDASMLACCLHKLYQVLVMLLRHLAIDAYIIVDHDNAGEVICHLVNVHLENI